MILILGLPYEKLDGFIKCSPITYAKNVRTPTLLLQGEADTTDPIGQSRQYGMPALKQVIRELRDESV